MRQITVRYAGTCAKCGNELQVGQAAVYEKSMGIFCVACEPKDEEEIREYRTIKAEKKAGRLMAKAERLEKEAEAKMSSFNSMRGDIAFLTQPGRIPARERMLRSYDRGIELIQEAKEAKERAEGIMYYKTRVKGDAERERQAKRDANDALIEVGSRVNDLCFGHGIVMRKNKKSYTIKFDSGGEYARDKSYVEPVK